MGATRAGGLPTEGVLSRDGRTDQENRDGEEDSLEWVIHEMAPSDQNRIRAQVGNGHAIISRLRAGEGVRETP